MFCTADDLLSSLRQSQSGHWPRHSRFPANQFDQRCGGRNSRATGSTKAWSCLPNRNLRAVGASEGNGCRQCGKGLVVLGASCGPICATGGYATDPWRLPRRWAARRSPADQASQPKSNWPNDILVGGEESCGDPHRIERGAGPHQVYRSWNRSEREPETRLIFPAETAQARHFPED